MLRRKLKYEQSEFSGIWDDITDSVSSLFDKVPNFYDEGVALFNKGIEYTKDKILEAKDLMAALLSKQSEVDKAIAAIPDTEEGRREKLELSKKRDESRGTFEEYVIPAWTSFTNALGISSDPKKAKEDFTFGVVPIAALAISASAATAAIAVIYWSKRSYDFEDELLKNAELAKIKYSQTSATGNLANLTGNLKWPLILGGIGLLGLIGIKYVTAAKVILKK